MRGPRRRALPNRYDRLTYELVHAYGYERLALTLTSLNRLGLLRRQEGKASWAPLKKALHLMVDEMADYEVGEEPPDMAYVHAGYAPLSVRFIHAMLRRREAPAVFEEASRLLPGPYFERGGTAGGAAAASAAAAAGEAAAGEVAGTERRGEAAAFDAAAAAKMCGECDEKPPVTLVFFVGGVTFAEVAALRWLGRNSTPRREYLVATTNLTTGDTMMESLIATCENQLESID